MGKHALIIVDEQYDFINGSLAVGGGEQVIQPSLELATEADLVVATRDWHPENHCSFVDEPQYHDFSWPPHCVANTNGADIPEEIDQIADVIVNKGYKPELETYSGFADEIEVARCPVGHWVGRRVALAELLRQLGVDRTTIVGLATDYCVIQTARDSLAAGFETRINRRAVRAVSPEQGEEVLNEFSQLEGASVVG